MKAFLRYFAVSSLVIVCLDVLVNLGLPELGLSRQAVALLGRDLLGLGLGGARGGIVIACLAATSGRLLGSERAASLACISLLLLVAPLATGPHPASWGPLPWLCTVTAAALGTGIASRTPLRSFGELWSASIWLGLTVAAVATGLQGRPAYLGVALGSSLLGLLSIRRGRPFTLLAATPVVGAVLVLALLFVKWNRPAKRPLRSSGTGPPIVLVVLDTVRADHLKSFGYGRDPMPGLEAWASGTLRFERAVAPGGWTRPTHASIFSGQTVSEHGIHYSASGDPSQNPRLFTLPRPGIRWLPAELAATGYARVAVSANFQALPRQVRPWNRRVVPARPYLRSALALLIDNVDPLLRPLSTRLRWRKPYLEAADIVHRVDRMVKRPQGPLFLFVNFLDAHAPYNPSARALREVGAGSVASISQTDGHREITWAWENLPDDRRQALVDLYDGELNDLDQGLTRLLDWVETTLGDEAVVIVTADHGEELGEEGRVGHEYGVGQAIVHVPLFVKAPWLASGSVREPVSLQRLYDFILEAARGGEPGPEVLLQSPGAGVLTERYPSWVNAAALGDEYDRAWVALFADSHKAVGPRLFGEDSFDVSAFDAPLPALPRPDLLDRIDAYWSQRDQREPARSVTDEERALLRSLGYVH